MPNPPPSELMVCAECGGGMVDGVKAGWLSSIKLLELEGQAPSSWHRCGHLACMSSRISL